ncbi:3-oxo-tetronate kinase [Lachnospiraceae bacterium 62-35]
MNLKLGCVADDFTGASDAASFLREQGIKTILFNGIPREELTESCGAAVIALKSRTAPVEEAVRNSLEALEWLKTMGAERLYVKYCSTFDSTKEGNIGPVLDGALERLGISYTLLCPSLPVNGRTVENGCLYIKGIPLHKTHMRNHPLTPMWDADIHVLMKEQSRYPCLNLSVKDMEEGREAVEEKIKSYARGKEHFYVIPDYYREEHGALILSCFPALPLLSGGSGLLSVGGLCGDPEKWEEDEGRGSAGKTLLLAGSCSKVTLEQIDNYRRTGNDMVRIYPEKVLSGQQSPESLWKEAGRKDKVLLYSSDSADHVKEIQEKGKERVAEMLEQTMAGLACLAQAEGYTQIIVAGGETSGAVIKGLGYRSYLIGKSIDPGVPVMIPTENRRLRLVLKSGNFGQPDFFDRAVKITAV